MIELHRTLNLWTRYLFLTLGRFSRWRMIKLTDHSLLLELSISTPQAKLLKKVVREAPRRPGLTTNSLWWWWHPLQVSLQLWPSIHLNPRNRSLTCLTCCMITISGKRNGKSNSTDNSWRNTYGYTRSYIKTTRQSVQPKSPMLSKGPRLSSTSAPTTKLMLEVSSVW